MIELMCLECTQPATWQRCTQFAGNHPYCEHHAKQESDFNDAADSYCFWQELESKMKHYSNTQNPVDFPEYEAVPIEQAEPHWKKRKQVLLARSQALVIALLGRQASESWWNSTNLAFEGQTPRLQFETNPERVYSYLMSHADGSYH